ncbi:mechanosensitive ion channel family protein [Pseudoalteromonas xiamenensis]|uniref:Mechanosensitive ion channel family protein n=1 Tax=Pseudoalteromonas xiamenensis TaxID=882626 RepID=A0A975DI27_9GAMM|nr:mechanosensitive ion channel family protein [Pseudoalteromonas xiamenensis]QTH70686.1 mechanosensitive ion channel family protein [Pseudoalteromonas xiamenensis]
MMSTSLQAALQPWFDSFPQGELISALISNGVGVVLLMVLYGFTRRLMLPSIQSLMTRLSPSRIGHLSGQLNKANRRLAMLITIVAFLASFEQILVLPDWGMELCRTGGQVFLVIMSGFLMSSIIGLAHGIYNQFSFAKEVPIQGIVQVAKLVTFIVCLILVVSIILDKSPTYILSGFGAIAAVTLLVFKDTILGFVASIQIAANRLVTMGDWIQMDTYGANGEVIDLGLNTVRVRNWDNTVTTIPTYALIAGSFKNWRAMQESAGRRITRALYLDLHSVTQLTGEQTTDLKQEPLLKEMEASLWQDGTNVAIFRRYAEAYINQHPDVSKDCLAMVRELQTLNHGLPIEIYCFSRNTSWVFYEHLQADLYDYLLAQLPRFGLRPYQSITGIMQP